MFENNRAEVKLLKKQKIMDAIDIAKKEGKEWKVKQLESKLYIFNKKNYPNILWNSSEKGTYKKPKKEVVA